MGPVFGYRDNPSLGPWTRSPGTVPPSSCRYINSGAIIGVCAFSQSPLGPAAAPLSYSFCLSRFQLRLSLSASVASTVSTLSAACPFSFSLSLCLSASSPSALSYPAHRLLLVFILLRLPPLPHPLTRPPSPFRPILHLAGRSYAAPDLFVFPRVVFRLLNAP